MYVIIQNHVITDGDHCNEHSFSWLFPDKFYELPAKKNTKSFQMFN